MLTLYDHPLSTCAQKVQIALGERDLPFETRPPGILGGSDRDVFARLDDGARNAPRSRRLGDVQA